MLWYSNIVLLASIISAFFSVHARPAEAQRGGSVIHIPLKRVHNIGRSDIHPILLYQQHANRGNRRLAQMTSRTPPTNEEMRRNIEKRLHILSSPHSASLGPRDEVNLEKRFYVLPGTPANPQESHSELDNREYLLSTEKTAAPIVRSHPRDISRGLMDRFKRSSSSDNIGVRAHHHHHKGVSAVNCTTDGGTVNGTSVVVNSTTSTGSTTGGFSQVDLNAANNGGLTASNVTDSTGTTGLAIVANDVGYVAQVQIGTPAQNFSILMDSGSADFWVGSTECKDSKTGAACGNQHHFLGPTTSSSFVDLGDPFEVTYGSGKVSGTIVSDTVTLAGMVLTGHGFGTSKLESPDFSGNDVAFDGLMGVAQSRLSKQGMPTPIEALAVAGAIPSAVTSFKLSRLADGTNDGQVTIGGLNTALFNATTLVSVPNVSQSGFWEVAVDHFSVNGRNLGLMGRTAIMDTGTTLIIAPPADAKAVHAAIPGSRADGHGGFTIPCTTTASIALTVGGRNFAIDPRDMTFLPVSPANLTGDCVSGISSGAIGAATEWLVGDVFLKNAYFSTDVTKNTVSLAHLV
ncbi:hypothetical protein BS47DRAFT_1342855 [Hydnum rufescens UP504]|uniref:Peptidase A1 domain-containing protein n=1 Tax=Hydnum rufescens UP504 TaxID=1448309 RepID=A0A9P6DY50_9AGAM|nr:hypothetical protein BS47DRAFT_1342855 [Hydnum rufescens UP504]